MTRNVASLFENIYSATKINFTLTRQRRQKFAYSRLTEIGFCIDLELDSLEKAEKIHSKLMDFVKIKTVPWETTAAE